MKSVTRVIFRLGFAVLFALAAAILITSVSGCVGHVHPDGTPVSSQEDALITANDSYTFALHAIATARKTGLLTDQQYAEICVPAEDFIDSALDEAGQDVAAGELDTAKLITDSALKAIDDLAAKLPALTLKKGK